MPTSEITQHVNPTPVVPVPDPMAAKVANLLSKADGYIASRQYDKAIATAETVLDLDPSNAAARAMVSKAKTRQMDALKSGSSLE
jgi:cytochrome c-type biogenesis protein CcmH/NrfG